jgi:hypothetical protein
MLGMLTGMLVTVGRVENAVKVRVGVRLAACQTEGLKSHQNLSMSEFYGNIELSSIVTRLMPCVQQ